MKMREFCILKKYLLGEKNLFFTSMNCISIKVKELGFFEKTELENQL
jgi:hypothetical protein